MFSGPHAAISDIDFTNGTRSPNPKHVYSNVILTSWKKNYLKLSAIAEIVLNIEKSYKSNYKKIFHFNNWNSRK